MQEQFSADTAGWLAAAAAKLLPAGFGALLIAAVDIPETRRELFLRVFAAMASSILFGDLVMSWVTSVEFFHFVDATKHSHQAAMNGIVGGAAWFALGASATFMKKFRGDPVGTVKDLKP